MPIYKRTTCCRSCPFRAESIPGWLGPFTAEQLEAHVKMDGVFICHETITAMKKKGASDDTIEEKGQHCVGFMRYMNAAAQLSRDDQRSQFQNILRKKEDVPVLKARQFVDHHTNGMKRLKLLRKDQEES
jgi:hypothetical protein